ncbi:MAG: alpha-L-fucosidase [Bacteroidota bacterium]
MKIKNILLVMIVLICLSTTYAQTDKKVKDDKNKRMEWWRDARFGMFIHWGLYSVPAGQWGEEKNHAEWIRETAHIPVLEYEKLLTQFNPVKFDANQWVTYAKNAGMKYIVLTSKHHDGFCLFNTQYTDFNVMHSPFKRDILKELADACRKQGMKICWYHSIMDWHHPDYLPHRDWETTMSATSADSYDRYFAYLKNELKEILNNYGDISILWFDGEWESTWTHKYAQELYAYLRTMKPDLIINNRIDTYRDGMGGLSTNIEALGDYGTPEQEIPETGMPGLDWETCMTMNDHWGYNKYDKNWKSTRDLLYNLVDVASKGGNYLLNVGPTSEGVFPPESIERLKEIGDWMKVNSESIYGTKASPFNKSTWGKCTQKEITGGTRLYLHLFNWPESKSLVIDNLINEPIKAYLLSDPNKKAIAYTKNGLTLKIPLPDKAPDAINSVVVLEIKGKPMIVEAPDFTYKYDVATDNLTIELKSKIANNNLKVHYTLDGTGPTIKSPVFNKSLTTKKQSQFKAIAFYGKDKIGETIKIKIPLSFGCKVKLDNEPSDKYKANGAASLTDDIYGSKNVQDKTWLGFEGTDFTAIVDLGKVTTIHNVGINYLAEIRSWIFDPLEIIIEGSEDGLKFKELTVKKFDTNNWKEQKGVNTFKQDIEKFNARYVRFKAKNRRTCPEGHAGAGGKAWVFISEITVD